ncbi:MAG: hypothetical protein JRL30_01155 [Deltaproteobacteria bacterium]|nr:hypothetical protein [Deltaproteobacteria bacterium]
MAIEPILATNEVLLKVPVARDSLTAVRLGTIHVPYKLVPDGEGATLQIEARELPEAVANWLLEYCRKHAED